MNYAALTRVELLFTRISLKHKLLLLLVAGFVALLLKLVLDANHFQNRLIAAHDMQSEQLAQALAKALPNLEESLSQSELQSLVPGYQLYILAAASTAPKGSGISSLPQQQKTVEGVDDKRALLWPIAQGRVLLLVDNSADTQAFGSSFFWRSLTETLIIAGLFVLILLFSSKMLIKQVTRLRERLQNMAQKDFSPAATVTGSDEFSQIEDAAESTRVNLIEVFQQQRTSTEAMMDMAEQLALCMDETKEAAQDEFAQVELLATAMHQMVATVQEIANNSEQASASTSDASELAASGNQNVMKTVETINQLASNIDKSSQAVRQVESRVQNIGSVVATINSISEQTNLLALNAAIEAARAGEYGRGFAVVADEVRNLAKRTQQATIEIQQMIEQLQSSAVGAGELMEVSVEQAHQSVSQVGSAGEGLGQIEEQVKLIAQMNYQIATAAEEQTSVVSEMNENLNNVKELIEGSVIVIDELSETANIITGHGDKLIGISKAFKVEAPSEGD